jgi:hypothetical protein
MQKRLDREQPGEQRYKDHANNGYTSTGHKLFYVFYEKILARNEP